MTLVGQEPSGAGWFVLHDVSFSWTPQQGYNLLKCSIRASLVIVGVEANRRLSPARSTIKPVTPSSVKGLMIVEAGVIGFLAYWIASEYVFNAYFHDSVDQLIGTHGTTFTAALGLGIGLTGSAIAATLYRNLQHAKSRLETMGTPKIRGAVEKILSSLPMVEEHQRISVSKTLPASPMVSSASSQVTSQAPVSPERDEKKLDVPKS
ncbi:MAG TPA: hypothetical protein VNA15_09645 [Candidatus Angelobacter sp.]|nr:hypothetical protein [Candidatus Angelobacter sp.]